MCRAMRCPKATGTSFTRRVILSQRQFLLAQAPTVVMALRATKEHQREGERKMSSQADPIKALEAAGIPVQAMPESQRKVIGELSSEEVSTLIKIQERLASVEDVQGYVVPKGDGYIFY